MKAAWKFALMASLLIGFGYFEYKHPQFNPATYDLHPCTRNAAK